MNYRDIRSLMVGGSLDMAKAIIAKSDSGSRERSIMHIADRAVLQGNIDVAMHCVNEGHTYDKFALVWAKYFKQPEISKYLKTLTLKESTNRCL